MNATEQIRGPRGWLNWYAERHGRPRRELAHPAHSVLQPIWEEFALYTDALLDGPHLVSGPFEFLMIDKIETATIGALRKPLILRAWDHLSDGPLSRESELRDDVEDYFGGDVGDEMAALLGLALGRRIRSGGSVRQGFPLDAYPLGVPGERWHHLPTLEPPRRRAMIPTLADPASMTDAADLLRTYPDLKGPDAVALVRAAGQYVDGLWLADADPRLAWLKLVGALEVAANHRDDTREDTPEAQLKRHRRKLWSAWKDAPPEAMKVLADEFARVYNVERKVRSFVRAFDPGPPAVRPAYSQFDWSELDEAVRVIYDHRSRDLHDGVPFPWPLCQPQITDAHILSERFVFLAATSHGGRWTKERLPLYLHVFAHVVGGALRGWWTSLAEARSQ